MCIIDVWKELDDSTKIMWFFKNFISRIFRTFRMCPETRNCVLVVAYLESDPRKNNGRNGTVREKKNVLGVKNVILLNSLVLWISGTQFHWVSSQDPCRMFLRCESPMNGNSKSFIKHPFPWLRFTSVGIYYSELSWHYLYSKWHFMSLEKSLRYKTKSYKGTNLEIWCW